MQETVGRPPAAADQVARESELAQQLLNATDEERPRLYGPAYDQIYGMSLPSREDTALSQTFGAEPYMLPHLLRLSRPGDAVLEVGCGCGFLSLELARRGRDVTGVDVSRVAIETARRHAEKLAVRRPTFQVENAGHLPFPDNHFSLVFSVEVVEHLHERDVPAHLAEVFRVLRPGGAYWLLTPNRLQGLTVQDRFGVDHDHGEGDETYDVHLKEWTYGELTPLMRSAGFERLRSPWRVRSAGWAPPLPAVLKVTTEHLARAAPGRRLRMLTLQAGGSVHLTLLGYKPDQSPSDTAPHHTSQGGMPT